MQYLHTNTGGLTLSHSERTQLYAVLAFLSAIGLSPTIHTLYSPVYIDSCLLVFRLMCLLVLNKTILSRFVRFPKVL